MPTIADGLGARRTAIRALERAYVSPQFPRVPRADYPASTAPTEHIPRRSPSLCRGLPAVHAGPGPSISPNEHVPKLRGRRHRHVVLQQRQTALGNGTPGQPPNTAGEPGDHAVGAFDHGGRLFPRKSGSPFLPSPTDRPTTAKMCRVRSLQHRLHPRRRHAQDVRPVPPEQAEMLSRHRPTNDLRRSPKPWFNRPGELNLAAYPVAAKCTPGKRHSSPCPDVVDHRPAMDCS